MGGCITTQGGNSPGGAGGKNGKTVQANEVAEVEDKAKLDAVNAQRRRLSVAPTLVGDVDGQRINLTMSKRSPQRIPLGPLVEGQVKDADKDHIASNANRHFAMSKKGYVPYNVDKKNQDAYVVASNLKGDNGISFFAVYDGHGEFGHHVSGFCRDNIIHFLEAEDIRANPELALSSAVDKMCEDLDRSKINTAFSGTTAIMGLKVDNVLYVGNIGDSRCVLATRKTQAEMQEPEESELVAKCPLKGVPLSLDQKPDVPEEKERILAAGGRVQTLPGLPGEDCGPMRVWLADVDIPGLAMARSIGDKISHTVGVTQIPAIVRHEIRDEDIFVLWASDGVWEFVDNYEAVAYVAKHLPELRQGVEELIEESNNRWFNNESVVDDITVIALILHEL